MVSSNIQFQSGSSLGFYQRLDDIRYSILVILLERKNLGNNKRLVKSKFKNIKKERPPHHNGIGRSSLPRLLLCGSINNNNKRINEIIKLNSQIRNVFSYLTNKKKMVSSNIQFQSGSSLGFYQRLDDIRYSILVILLERKNLAKSGHRSSNIQFQSGSSLGFYQRLDDIRYSILVILLERKNLEEEAPSLAYFCAVSSDFQFQSGSSLGFYQQLDDIRYSILVILLERKNLVSSNFQFQSGSSLGFDQRLDDIRYSILVILLERKNLGNNKRLAKISSNIQFQSGSSLGFDQRLDDIRYSILLFYLKEKILEEAPSLAYFCAVPVRSAHVVIVIAAVSSNFQFQSGSSLGFYQQLDDIRYSILVILLERKNLGNNKSSSPISARVSSNFQFQSGSSLGFYQQLDDIRYSILVILLERKNLAKFGLISSSSPISARVSSNFQFQSGSSLGFYQQLDDIRYSILVILLERKNLAKSGHCSFNIQFQSDNPRGYCYRVSSNIQFQSGSSLGFYQRLDDIRYSILPNPVIARPISNSSPIIHVVIIIVAGRSRSCCHYKELNHFIQYPDHPRGYCYPGHLHSRIKNQVILSTSRSSHVPNPVIARPISNSSPIITRGYYYRSHSRCYYKDSNHFIQYPVSISHAVIVIVAVPVRFLINGWTLFDARKKKNLDNNERGRSSLPRLLLCGSPEKQQQKKIK
ncbi:hypothetical protein Glove_17g68 [Diversispora epigaea]|uniref:Uncharacterized protein n=1 Tax=Diversispora epigaea TaxID=1348612 RepID=A0A397JLI8_9GLOM|nr:hypothetical protein Glove_17g68 [Diversispora epigaea]